MTAAPQPAIEEMYAWIASETARCIQDCRITADDGTTLFMPGSAQHTLYRAIWTRDFSYMLQYAPELFQPDEIKAAIQYILDRQRADGAIPDHVSAAGEANFPVFGSDPATDNPSFLIQAADVYLRRSGDIATLQSWLPALTAGLRSIPRNRGTGMVWIDPLRPHCSYGFTDIVNKTGDELFCSLLFQDASLKLSAWWEEFGIGDEEQANKHRDHARYIRDHLHQFWDEEAQLYNAATYHCNQNDIWGSAYACSEALAPEAETMHLAVSLRDKKDLYVLRGQIRHLPLPYVWEMLQSNSKDYRNGAGGQSTKFVLSSITPGKYQNGAYWATPLLWIYKSIAKLDQALALAILTGAIEDFQANGIWEWVNVGEHAERDYVASVVSAYAAMKIAINGE